MRVRLAMYGGPIVLMKTKTSAVDVGAAANMVTDRRRFNANGPVERIRLGNFPTKLSRAPAELCAELGVDLWIKNEFEADSYGSGNKVRKLEYLIPKLLRSGDHGLVVDGTTQSNCAMALALYGPRFGLSVDLVLYGPTTRVGNFADMVKVWRQPYFTFGVVADRYSGSRGQDCRGSTASWPQSMCCPHGCN